MAVLSDYTSGTISLANGSATVTGTGTLFEVTRFREGDTLQIQNLTAVIASVDSDTQLTLTEPWTGTSIVDGPYRARQLADGTRVGTQAATLIELLGDGTLAGIAALGVEEGKALVGGPAGQYELVDTSTFGIQDPNGNLGKLAALTLAANKILNTDGSGNLTQSDITALGRNLLDDATGEAMFATMGVTQSLGGGAGYCRLPNGFLIQWTAPNVTPDADGYTAVPFPTTFSNTLWVGVAMNAQYLANPQMLVLQNRDGLQTGQMDLRLINSATGAAITTLSRVNVIAIGN